MDATNFLGPIFLFGAIGVIILIVTLVKANQRRKMELAAFAASQGFSQVHTGQFHLASAGGGFFAPMRGPDLAFMQRFGDNRPFNVGNNRRLDNLIAGSKDGMDWYFFDYSYQEQSGENTTTFSYAVAAVRIPMRFPHLTLEPETIFSKLGQHLGFHEIKVELNAFNDRYCIQSDDPKRTFDILSPQMIEYLMQLPSRTWLMYGNCVFVAERAILTAPFCQELMSELKGLIDRLPPYVKQDYGFQPPWTGAFD